MGVVPSNMVTSKARKALQAKLDKQVADAAAGDQRTESERVADENAQLGRDQIAAKKAARAAKAAAKKAAPPKAPARAVKKIAPAKAAPRPVKRAAPRSTSRRR